MYSHSVLHSITMKMRMDSHSLPMAVKSHHTYQERKGEKKILMVQVTLGGMERGKAYLLPM